jgi:hypothetical protein
MHPFSPGKLFFLPSFGPLYNCHSRRANPPAVPTRKKEAGSKQPGRAARSAQRPARPAFVRFAFRGGCGYGGLCTCVVTGGGYVERYGRVLGTWGATQPPAARPSLLLAATGYYFLGSYFVHLGLGRAFSHQSFSWFLAHQLCGALSGCAFLVVTQRVNVGGSSEIGRYCWGCANDSPSSPPPLDFLPSLPLFLDFLPSFLPSLPFPYIS